MKYLVKNPFFLIIIVSGLCVLAQAAGPATQDNFVYDDKDKRDPFWSLVSSDGVIVNYDNDLILSDLILEGVIVDNQGNNLAIINGQILKNQDNIGPFIIIKIERDHVVVEKKGQQFMLYLKKEE